MYTYCIHSALHLAYGKDTKVCGAIEEVNFAPVTNAVTPLFESAPALEHALSSGSASSSSSGTSQAGSRAISRAGSTVPYHDVGAGLNMLDWTWTRNCVDVSYYIHLSIDRLPCSVVEARFSPPLSTVPTATRAFFKPDLN